MGGAVDGAVVVMGVGVGVMGALPVVLPSGLKAKDVARGVVGVDTADGASSLTRSRWGKENPPFLQKL